MSHKAIILAAGKGKRLGSETSGVPKVMRLANGRPLLSYVVDALNLPPCDVIIVAGYMRERVIAEFPGHPIAVQEHQLGTADAVKSALPLLQGFKGDVIVCCGDMPLVRRESYAALSKLHSLKGNDATILTGTYPRQMPMGRIVRSPDDSFERIVEAKDSDAELDKIREYNSGIYVFRKIALESS
ncbi:MAG: NTP transferase domain-containing protein, partial [Oscillospiraceae bacterium]|nr:NTP transferase domain-containing protein [Oscillospiraceae bacterium]